MWTIAALVAVLLSLRTLLSRLVSAYLGLGRPVSPRLSDAFKDL